MYQTTAIATLRVAAIFIILFSLSSTMAASSSFDGSTILLGSEVLASNDSDGGVLRCERSVAVSGNAIVVAWNDS